MDLGLNGKTVFVTGGTSLIGSAIAEQFGREGANVAVSYYRSQRSSEKMVKRLSARGVNTIAVKMDLNDEGSIVQAIEEIVNRWGKIDVLVNNAVYWPSEAAGHPFENQPGETWRRAVRANLEGTFFMIQKAVPYMKREGWGRIITLSSTLAENGRNPRGEVYSAAKAGLHGLTATLAKDLGEHGIFSNVVLPGLIQSERLKNLPQHLVEEEVGRTPTKRLSKPEDISNVVVFLASQANGHLNGELIRVTGGHNG